MKIEKMFEFRLDFLERLLYLLFRTFVLKDEIMNSDIYGTVHMRYWAQPEKRRDLYADYLYYQLPPWRT